MSLDLSTMEDIAPLMTPYLMQTLITLHRVYGSSSDIMAMCCELSLSQAASARAGATSAPVFPIGFYNMRERVDKNPIPSPRPFIPDFSAAVIPRSQKLPAWLPPSTYTRGRSVMDDVVEAMRQTTHLTRDGDGYLPPTTLNIQYYMANMWPDKYDGNVAEAKGWRNSVNQCLTHGQGINFLTYSVDGKNKRHLLFERAFNGVCVLGSGQCKSLNDSAKAAKKSQSPTLPIPTAPDVQPTHYTSPTLLPSPTFSTSSSSTTTSSSASSGYGGMSSRILSSSDLNPIPSAELDTEYILENLNDFDYPDLLEVIGSHY